MKLFVNMKSKVEKSDFDYCKFCKKNGKGYCRYSEHRLEVGGKDCYDLKLNLLGRFFVFIYKTRGGK